MDEFLSLGFRTVITTLDKEALPERLLGKEVDEKLLMELPESVDVCGENGEFHTIVTDGQFLHIRFPCSQAKHLYSTNASLL